VPTPGLLDVGFSAGTTGTPTRQRKRLAHRAADNRTHAPGTALAAPSPVQSSPRTTHLRFVRELLKPAARLVHDRPWGFGFSDVCLLTGDVPAVILNGHDDRDQLASAAHWDIVLPLDPRRFLFLSGPASWTTRPNVATTACTCPAAQACS